VLDGKETGRKRTQRNRERGERIKEAHERKEEKLL